MDDSLAKRVSLNNFYKYKLLQGGLYRNIAFINRGDDFGTNLFVNIAEQI